MDHFETDLEQSRRGPVAWMAGHSVAANLVMLTCLVGGLLALWNIKQEVFPDTERDVVTVSVAYPGASPAEVERGLILAVEEAVQGLDGVKEVASSASEGSGRIDVEALVGANVQKLADDVRNAVDRIRTFPDDAEQPEVRISSWSREVLELIIYGPVDTAALHEMAELARDQLLQNPNITLVEVEGIPPLEIAVEITPENLRRYGLTLDDVARRLGSDSIERPGGGLKTTSGEILIRVTERRDWGSQFARMPIITTADGSQVLLGDIATIRDAFADTDRWTHFNAHPAVTLEVYRVGDQTPTQVAKAVLDELPALQADLPDGVRITIHNNSADVYADRVRLLAENGLLGLALVLVLLGLFLEARLAFWVMMSIPISFFASFLFLPAADVTINMMSLFAYIIVIGMVVDNGIVVGENIYRYAQQGMPVMKAAIAGTREVAMPVTFSILTNCVSFVPIYFIPGTMGRAFKMVPVVVCIVFLISLGEAVFVLPSQLGHQKFHRPWGPFGWLHDRQQAFSDAFHTWSGRRWRPVLTFLLRHRAVTISLSACALALSLCYALSGRMRFEVMPTVESDRADGSVVLPYGAPVQRTEAIVQRMEDAARQVAAEAGHPELIQYTIADVGRGGGHNGQVRVELAPPEIRDAIMTTTEFTNRWRGLVGEVTGVEYIRFSAESGGMGGRGRPLSVQLSHRDMAVLERASRDLAATMEQYPRVTDVDDGFQPGKPQLDVTITPEGRSLGLTSEAVAAQVRHAFYGAEAVRQQRGRGEVKVMLRLPKADRSTEQTIADLMIRTPAGTFVPFREVASYTRGRAYTSINRRNGRRVVDVSADINPRGQAGEVLDDVKAAVLPDLQGRYAGLLYSFEGHRAEMRDSLDSLKVSFPIALLVLYVMLAIPFRSYVQPLIIMTSIPFGIVGAFLGHLIMGYDLCLPSIFGIVALGGVVVNDALVLVDFANRRCREDGTSPREAMIDAGTIRLRPVILTTLTTFGGLAPMIFETSRQARFLIPMALSLGFGILFATFITLVLVPALYVCVDDVARYARAARRFLAGDTAETPPAARPRVAVLPEQEVAK
ncbi:MAG: efflux RND transporter permease subunit [Planctomycetes bacterium]|nr:efflux RND transporter permease subunit [Planctomycetota bacterium]